MGYSKGTNVVELATKETFFPEGYILANRDLYIANVDPFVHFKKYGEKERRKQLSKVFIEDKQYRIRKFNLFKNLIDDPNINSFEKFPITVGKSVLDLSQYQSESANGSFGPFVEEIRQNPDKLYLDLGCGLRDIVFDNCLYLEVYNSLSADIIVDPVCIYPIKNECLDGIGCFAVLEHTRKPWLVVSEICRMLKPGGTVYIDWPFLQPIHGFPSHFFNATREGLVSIFEDNGFHVKDAQTWHFQGPDHTISWILGQFLDALPINQRDKIMKMSVKEFVTHRAEDAFWQEVLTNIDDSTRSKFACGNTIIAKKSAALDAHSNQLGEIP